MNIFVDQQIVLSSALFSTLGKVTTYHHRDLSNAALQQADILITRSTLKVDQRLLEGTPVKFVGTCTIGKDHLDSDYLDQQGIVWTNAPSCNANSVIQYVLSAMAQLRPQWLQQRVGIIACGSIGGKVYRCLKALGVECVAYDPFLSQRDIADLTSLDDVLMSDIILSHAPLTTSGEFPTKYLLDTTALAKIPEGSLLVSAGRGAVIDNQALLSRLQNNNKVSVVLDVWEDEPDISAELLALVDIATPHIAGHSIEGKKNGSWIVYQALCRFLHVEPTKDSESMVYASNKALDNKLLDMTLSPAISAQELLNTLLLSTYPIMNDDALLRQYNGVDSLGHHFEHLRKHYSVRHELSYYTLPTMAQYPQVKQWLKTLMELH